MLRSSYAARRVAHAVGAAIETMEPRRLLSSIAPRPGGTLEITGSDAANQIRISQTWLTVRVEIDGVSRSFLSFWAQRLVVRGLGGTDRLVNSTNLPATLDGGGGNDVLIGGSAGDRFIGADGIDTADYSARPLTVDLSLDGKDNDGGKGEGDNLDNDVEILIGGSGNDRLVGNGLSTTLIGNGGNDYLAVGASTVTVAMPITPAVQVTRPVGPITPVRTPAKAQLIGGGSNLGTDGNDTLVGGPGNDLLDGGAGDDSITGGGGDDSVIAGTGNDFLNGEAGNDLYDYSSRTEKIIGRFGAGLQSGKITIGAEIDIIGDDAQYRFLSGSAADDLKGDTSIVTGQPVHFITIDGGGGDDIVNAGGLDSVQQFTLRGGEGNDKFRVTFDSRDAVVMYGDGGDDACTVSNPLFFHGGDGIDLYTYDEYYGRDLDLRTMPTTENLTLTGAEGGFIDGNELANVIKIDAGFVKAVYGMGGNDTITGRFLAESLDGGAGNDTITGNGGNDTINGGEGDDYLDGGDGDDSITGGNGTDTIVPGLGNDAVNAEAGNDLYDYSARTEALVVRLSSSPQSGKITQGIETDIIGDDIEYRFLSGSGNDDLKAETSQYGGEHRHYLDVDGSSGNDSLQVFGFEAITLVTLRGGNGDDTLKGGPDSSPSVTMFGDAGNDFCELSGPYPIQGGDGNDTVSFRDLFRGDVDLRTMSTENLILKSQCYVRSVFGTEGDNMIAIQGDSLASVGVYGLGGNDTLVGGGNLDTLDGGEGNDVITCGIGRDVLIGGPGDDLFFNLDPWPSTGTTWADTIDGGDGNDTVQGDAADVLTSVEVVV